MQKPSQTDSPLTHLTELLSLNTIRIMIYKI